MEPAPTDLGTVVAAEVQLHTETGECADEVLVFAQGGYLSSLELCSWSDDIEGESRRGAALATAVNPKPAAFGVLDRDAAAIHTTSRVKVQ